MCLLIALCNQVHVRIIFIEYACMEANYYTTGTIGLVYLTCWEPPKDPPAEQLHLNPRLKNLMLRDHL